MSRDVDPAHMPEIAFTTARTRVRPWQDSDLGALLAIYGDREVVRWIGDGEPLSAADAQRWLEITRANYARRGYGMFAVTLQAQPEVIGFCGLVHPGDQDDAEIKYAYARRYWGRGIATEVAQRLLAYAASRHGLRRVIATTASENVASHRVLLKAGMLPDELRTEADGSATRLFVWERPSGA